MTINKLLNVAKTSTLQLICECFASRKGHSFKNRSFKNS
jgi:hypothetical protein